MLSSRAEINEDSGFVSNLRLKPAEMEAQFSLLVQEQKGISLVSTGFSSNNMPKMPPASSCSPGNTVVSCYSSKGNDLIMAPFSFFFSGQYGWLEVVVDEGYCLRFRSAITRCRARRRRWVPHLRYARTCSSLPAITPPGRADCCLAPGGGYGWKVYNFIERFAEGVDRLLILVAVLNQKKMKTFLKSAEKMLWRRSASQSGGLTQFSVSCQTKRQWKEFSWNPLFGCTPCGAGCSPTQSAGLRTRWRLFTPLRRLQPHLLKNSREAANCNGLLYNVEEDLHLKSPEKGCAGYVLHSPSILPAILNLQVTFQNSSSAESLVTVARVSRFNMIA